MTTLSSIKPIIDRSRWRPEAPAFSASSAGSSFAYDMRNDTTNHPFIYYLRSATALDIFDPIHGDWMPLASPGLTGTFGAGATTIFHPSLGPRGTIAAGATTTTLTLTTALPLTVGLNQLANRGDGIGFTIRIIGNAAGGSGKIEERRIVANTSSTTPLLVLDSPLSFTPGVGCTYEFLSGRVYLLSAGTTAAGCWKYYDVLTNSYSASLSVTNLTTTISTDSSAVALSEVYVPWNRIPGEGFVDGTTSYNNGSMNCIQATATAATTITGSGMFADLQTNEYRNGQIRIVEDTTTPTAVGQRRRIVSHTSGAAGVFTVATWTVTPSATAKFVIENDDDKILVTSSASANVYNYNIAANTWDITTWVAGVASGAGVVLEQSFGITRDPYINARHLNVFKVRGGSATSIDVLSLSAGTTGVWTSSGTYANSAQTFTTGTSGAYDPVTNEGKYLHINVNGTNRMTKFDMKNRVMEANAYIDNNQSTAVVGAKMAFTYFVDGATKIAQLYQILHGYGSIISLTVPIPQLQQFPTYNAVIFDFTPVANATDFLTVLGNSNKLIKIWNITVSGFATAASIQRLYLIKRSSLNTGGTVANVIPKPLDGLDSVSSSVVNTYSVNPTSLGTGSAVKSDLLYLPASGTPTDAGKLVYQFGLNNKKPLTLRGANELLAFSLGAQAVPAGTNLHINIEYTEE